MSPVVQLLVSTLPALTPHLCSVGAIAARLLPVVFCGPLLGGSHAPATVKLGIVLSLSVSLHLEAGIGSGATLAPDLLSMLETTLSEACCGLTLGLVASLPFDAARVGGRLIDLFRGSSAEAALPLAGVRESAAGDALHTLLLALVAASAVWPTSIEAISRSFVSVPLGAFAATEPTAMRFAALVGSSFATGLAIGAPMATASLAVDATLGLASRAAPGLSLNEIGAPLRVLCGAALFWLLLGFVAHRLLGTAEQLPVMLRRVLEASP